MPDRKPRILLGVTVSQSLILMRGLPAFLADRGWDVHVVSSSGPEQDALRGIDGVTVHSLAMARNPSPLADLRSLWMWIRLLRSGRPDLVSVGTPKAGLLGGIAALLTRVPRRVYMLRGLRLATASGAGRAVLAVFERISIGTAHTVVAVSPSLRAEVIELGLTRPDKVVVLGAGSSNGVDLDAFGSERFSESDTEELRRILGIDTTPPVVGFVGRLTADKGLGPLAEARRLLVDRGIDHQLLLVGQTEESGADAELALLRSAGRLPVETGAVTDPAPYYRVMDVLCLPTLREGFPNVVLEAAASGVPAVTTDATGAVDSVVDGVTGLIAHAGSGVGLADALATVIGDADARTRMGEESRLRVELDFDRVTVAARTESFYRAELARSPRAVAVAETGAATR